MKKKGRICGTIGLILSLALAGGTVVYGTMFAENAVGKAEKPIGSATGNVFDGWINKSGFDETKTLVTESGGIFDGSKKDGKYKSYSLSFTQTSTITTTGEGAQTVNSLTEGVIYTDSDYTYLKLTDRYFEGRTTTISAEEYVLSKSDGVWYARTNTSAATENVDDTPLLDKAKWERVTDAASSAANLLQMSFVFGQMTEVFGSVNSDNPVYLGLTGEYHFKDTSVTADYLKGDCRFTVGLCPTIRHTLSLSETDETKSYGTITTALQYSNLNNTKVDLPDSVKEAMKK